MLPKGLSRVRYKSGGEFNIPISIIQPNNGQATDGTPLATTTVATTWANVAMWKNKEIDNRETRNAQSSYKITIRYPKTYNIDTGMQIMVRNQLHFIDSFSDPDGQMVELCIWTWVEDDSITAGA